MRKKVELPHRAMGIYQIQNVVNGKVLIGAALNVQGILNRHKFELQMGKHRNQALQNDWHEFGSENFTFEILDEITPTTDPPHDNRADLAELEELWLDNLLPFDERGYNERKKSRTQKLQDIARNRMTERWQQR